MQRFLWVQIIINVRPFIINMLYGISLSVPGLAIHPPFSPGQTPLTRQTAGLVPAFRPWYLPGGGGGRLGRPSSTYCEVTEACLSDDECQTRPILSKMNKNISQQLHNQWQGNQTWDPFHLWFFARNLIPSNNITANFCTYHESITTAVLLCDMQNFVASALLKFEVQQNRIPMQKSCTKLVPGTIGNDSKFQGSKGNINWLAPEWNEQTFPIIIFKMIFHTIWILILNTTSLVQVLTWCLMAPIHYKNSCSPSFIWYDYGAISQPI